MIKKRGRAIKCSIKRGCRSKFAGRAVKRQWQSPATIFPPKVANDMRGIDAG
jgi:hypothetical protein